MQEFLTEVLSLELSSINLLTLSETYSKAFQRKKSFHRVKIRAVSKINQIKRKMLVYNRFALWVCFKRSK